MIDKKRLDPGLRFAADLENEFDLEGGSSVEELRELMVGEPFPVPDDIKVWDEYIGLDDGYRLRIKFYESKNRSETEVGAFYWMHGGGMALGAPEMDDAACVTIAQRFGIVVASVDYRLTPEYPYPVPLEDCYAGLVWIADNADDLGIDRSHIAIGGSSAGGGLCAALALLARDRKGPEIFFQTPLFPMLDDTISTPSALEFTKDVIPFTWNSDGVRICWDWYLKDVDPANIPIYAAPARAQDLSGLPPAYSCVSDLDPLRDETVAYMMRLMQAGVSAELHIYTGAFHGFMAAEIDSELGNRACEELFEAIGLAFERYQ
jgi:acetyl esterase/lipase